MQSLPLAKKILATSLVFSSFAFANDIGDITEHKGSGGITREGESFTTELGLSIQQMDAIETAKGRMKLTFLDDTVLRLVEHTEVVLTKYYFDPDICIGNKVISLIVFSLLQIPSLLPDSQQVKS